MEEELSRMGTFLQDMSTNAADFGIRLLAALAIFALGVTIKHILRALLKKMLSIKMPERMTNKTLSATRIKSINSMVLAIYDFIAWFIIAVNSLSRLGVNVTSLLTVAGVGGIAIGLGAQTLVKDMVAGLLFFLEDQYHPGDIITVGDVTGEVERMTLRITAIREYSGDLHILPNGEIRAVTNVTRSYHKAIVDLSLDYGENLGHVSDVLRDELEKSFQTVPGLSEVPTCIGVTELADSGVIMRVVAECEVKMHWQVERELRRRIKDRFDEEGIELSLPQMVVHEKKDIG